MQILSHSIKLKHLITRNKDVAFKIKVKSPPTRGAWIEMGTGWWEPPGIMSPPARGAWIKITDGVC